MRIVYITAGAAGSYCGVCARDVTLARALTASGHDVQLIPLYTPVRADGPDPSSTRVFYGGINVYLQQRSALFGMVPAFIARLLDKPALLRLVSRFAVRTRPEDLGPLTVSVLEGADGRQCGELDRLIRHLEREARPDVVNLSNSLLSGLAPAVRGRLGVPVVCTLQGEDQFVARLPEPHRERALAALRRNAGSVSRFIAPGEAYAGEMADFLGVPRADIEVVRAGVDVAAYTAAAAVRRPDQPFRIGFLSRLSYAKGLDVLCRAFCIVERRRPGGAVLAVAGQAPGPDAAFWAGLRDGLAADGLGDRVEDAGELDLAGKVDFLARCSVFCLPERFAEPRGIACLEAMGAGLPAVVPALGIFPEIVALTGGGVCVPPDDVQALADALCALRDEPERTRWLGEAAAAGVAEHFSARRMAERTLAVYERETAHGH